jgi:hypothetical protein
MHAASHAPLEGAAVNSGTVATGPAITLNELIDAYIIAYDGRDKSRHARVGWWRERLGACILTTITNADIFQALHAYASAPVRVYAGLDVNGERIWCGTGNIPGPATINRHHTALSALFKWAI